MKVVGIEGSVKLYGRFAGGVTALGDKFEIATSITDQHAINADAFFQNNIIKPKFLKPGIVTPYEFILESKKPFIVRESPNFRKYESGWQRLGWFSYKWTDGLFGNLNAPPDRWNKFQKETGIRIKDWKSPGNHILIMGQKEGDSSLTALYNSGYSSFYNWVEEIILKIRKYSDRKIIIRPHPRNLSRGTNYTNDLIRRLTLKNIKNIELSSNLTQGGNQGGEGLNNDLNNAYCVVTYNSLSGVESVCDGIPTFAFENGSMIWPIAHKDISTIENLNYNIDVTQWCYDIMYTQWHNDEVQRGEAWAHLKPLVFK